MSEVRVPGAAGPLALPPFFELVALDSVDSTSSEVVRRADAGAGEGLLVWARQQTKGRGRRGRQWESPVGNLYCSLLLEPEVEAATAAELGFVVGVSIRECVESLVPDGHRVCCKWPNDVLVNGSKIAGALLEATARKQTIRVVTGIGINLVSHPSATPYPATNLKSLGSDTVDPAHVIEPLMNCFLQWYEIWRRRGFGVVREAWLERAAGLGEVIDVNLAERTLSGTFISLSERGALELRDGDGDVHVITAGDVFLPSANRGAE